MASTQLETVHEENDNYGSVYYNILYYTVYCTMAYRMVVLINRTFPPNKHYITGVNCRQHFFIICVLRFGVCRRVLVGS